MSGTSMLKEKKPNSEELVRAHLRVHEEAVKRMKWKAGIRMEIITLITARVACATPADVITAAKEIESYVMGET